MTGRGRVQHLTWYHIYTSILIHTPQRYILHTRVLCTDCVGYVDCVVLRTYASGCEEANPPTIQRTDGRIPIPLSGNLFGDQYPMLFCVVCTSYVACTAYWYCLEPLLLIWVNFNPTWISDYGHYIVWMKLLIHSQTSTVGLFKFGNG